MLKFKKIKTSKKILSLLFASGVFLIIAAGIVWAANEKLKSVSAHEQSGASDSGSGEFSEEWTASEIYGQVSFYWESGIPNGSIDWASSAWVATTVPRVDTNKWKDDSRCDGGECYISVGSQSYRPVLKDRGNYIAKWHDSFNNQDAVGVLNIANEGIVTKWKVNGHIHP